MFHGHRWVTTGAEFNPPRPFEGERIAHDTILALTNGFTNVTQTCTRCGLVRTEQHPGRIAVEVETPESVGRPEPAGRPARRLYVPSPGGGAEEER